MEMKLQSHVKNETEIKRQFYVENGTEIKLQISYEKRNENETLSHPEFRSIEHPNPCNKIKLFV